MTDAGSLRRTGFFTANKYFDIFCRDTWVQGRFAG